MTRPVELRSAPRLALALALALVCLSWGALLLACTHPRAAEDELSRLQMDSGCGSAQGTAPTTANPQSSGPPRSDWMLAIDRSASTASASGLDANGDGAVDREFCSGFRRFGTLAAMLNLCGRSPDSILDAELELAGTLLDELAPQATRIGVVTFSGDGNRRTPDAVVASPLNADPAPARAALAELDQTGPAGQTNLVEALRLATSELLAARPGPSEARSSGRVVLLSSGGPTLPARGDPRLNALLALEAAKAAARCRVSVDVYQIGNSAAEENGLLRRIAETTRGRFRLVRQLKGSEAGAVPQP